MSRWNLAWLIGLPAVIVVSLTVVFAAPRTPRPKDQDYEMVQLVVDVMSEVDQKYVRELSPEQRKKFIEDMINGGLERLDPYSSYFNSDDYHHFMKQTEGAFGGVGIQIDVDRTTGFLQVTSPMVGTPAYEAGVLAGDLVIKVDEQNHRKSSDERSYQNDPGRARDRGHVVSRPQRGQAARG